MATVSSLVVGPGATLSGTGTAGNTIINDGALSPGSGSIGTLTVSGNLTFTSAATYMVALTPATASRTNVVGAAGLNGATVNANFAAGSYVAKQYTILNATGVLAGTFNPTVVSNMSSLTSTLSYDAHNVFLNIALNAGGGGASGGSITNAQAVGNALTNFFNANGGIPAVFASLTPAGLPKASGEGATGSQQTGFSAMN